MIKLKLGFGVRTIPIKTTNDCIISKKAVEEILQETGDKIADMLEQMIAGDWLDSQGHRVEDNKQMYALGQHLLKMAEWRTEHLGYLSVKEKPNV
jgi:hypothetical protein